VRLRDLGLSSALILALLPAPAQAQGDFIKGKLKDLIERSGVYVSASTRTSIDNDVRMGPSLGVGYGAAGRQRMTYGAQLGVGYSFNSVTLNPGVGSAFGVPEPVGVTVSNSWVLRPQVKAEYFLTRKLSLKTQLSYTYTDPDVVIHTVTQDFNHEWRPHHVQLTFAVGVFPFRK
jgi:hypothetical protein